MPNFATVLHSPSPSRTLSHSASQPACASFGVSFVVIYAEPCGSEIPHTPRQDHICMLQLHVCARVCVCAYSCAQIKSKAKKRSKKNTRNNNKHAGRTFLLPARSIDTRNYVFDFYCTAKHMMFAQRERERWGEVKERERERETANYSAAFACAGIIFKHLSIRLLVARFKNPNSV